MQGGGGAQEVLTFNESKNLWNASDPQKPDEIYETPLPQAFLIFNPTSTSLKTIPTPPPEYNPPPPGNKMTRS